VSLISRALNDLKTIREKYGETTFCIIEI